MCEKTKEGFFDFIKSQIQKIKRTNKKNEEVN